MRRVGPTSVLLAGVAVLGALVAGCSGQNASDALLEDIDRIVETESKEVSVFYPSADIIAEERVVVDTGESPELAALRELFKAEPRNPDLKVTLPKATVRSVDVRDGIAWVDFGRDVIVTGESGPTQRVALAAIIYTLKQFDGIEKVAFTVEGKTRGAIDGKDIGAFWGAVRIDDQPWDARGERADAEGAQ